MTMSLEPSTMISIIENIFCSLVKNGVRKILVINGHDGNIAPIEIASRKVKNETKDSGDSLLRIMVGIGWAKKQRAF